jgi:hypothetical protein
MIRRGKVYIPLFGEGLAYHLNEVTVPPLLLPHPTYPIFHILYYPYIPISISHYLLGYIIQVRSHYMRGEMGEEMIVSHYSIIYNNGMVHTVMFSSTFTHIPFSV